MEAVFDAPVVPGCLQQGFSRGLAAAYIVTGVRRGFFIPVALADDPWWYTFSPPQWSNMPPPLTQGRMDAGTVMCYDNHNS